MVKGPFARHLQGRRAAPIIAASSKLYDLKKDLNRLHNAASDPPYADVKRDLSERLMAQLRATADPRALG
ncbi:MAG TPA: hypothetical protein VMY37_09980 [Thermoguttaceae bacterium]|nr:hypothetical protein [Thermoguttaceae bacterium]